MRISSREKIKPFKNKSFDSKSIISSDYVFLKNGNVKRKRNKNSYYEAFLEKRRMAAEFAQSKRCYSTVSTKITYANKNNNKRPIYGLQDIINMNNLKHNLPGKATPIIDNTNNIYNEDYFFSKNIINHKNNNSLSFPNFEEIKHLTNKSNANNDFNNNLNQPYELENDANEETSKFGNKDRIIDTNQSRKIEIIPVKNFEIISNSSNNINQIKNNSTYIKKRPKRDDSILIATLRQNKNSELNNNNNQVETSISFRNDLNNNNNIKEKNNSNINNRIENINSNDFSIKYNESKNKDINRYIDTNNNEEDNNNIKFFNNIIQKKNRVQNFNNELKNNENIQNNETDQNEISNEAIEETNVIKDNIDDINEKNNNIYNKNIGQKHSKIINNDYKVNNSFTEKNKNNKDNIEIIKKNIANDVKQNYQDIPKLNISSKEKEKLKLNEINPNNNDIIFKNYENKKKQNINLTIFNEEIKDTFDNDFPSNKLSKKSKNFDNDNINNMNKNNKGNKNIFSLIINKDIEKLNKIKNIPKKNNDNINYFDEINNLINQIKGKRNNINNDFINKTNENKEKLLLLENQKKDLKLFQNQINSALNYNKKRISFPNEKLDDEENNNNNQRQMDSIESKRKTNNNKNSKFKVNISTRMQNLLNKLKKEKISNNIDEYDENFNVNSNKNIFNKNVIDSINNFIKDEHLNNNHINNIIITVIILYFCKIIIIMRIIVKNIEAQKHIITITLFHIMILIIQQIEIFYLIENQMKFFIRILIGMI